MNPRDFCRKLCNEERERNFGRNAEKNWEISEKSSGRKYLENS